MTNERNNREKDTFKDGIFFWQEWSAPRLIFADDIRETIGRFALVGRRIKQMQILGTCYTYLGYVVEERAEVVLAHLGKEKCERMSRYMNIDHEMRFPRWAQIDRPFMIAFDDGDVFEIDIPWEMEFRMSMNCIPWDTNPSGEYNLDADVLFSNCLGQRIVAVELGTEMRDAHPVTGEPFIKLPFSRECVEHIILRLENGVALKLYGFADYCEVKCIDAHDEMLDIRFGDLKKVSIIGKTTTLMKLQVSKQIAIPYSSTKKDEKMHKESASRSLPIVVLHLTYIFLIGIFYCLIGVSLWQSAVGSMNAVPIISPPRSGATSLTKQTEFWQSRRMKRCVRCSLQNKGRMTI